MQNDRRARVAQNRSSARRMIELAISDKTTKAKLNTPPVIQRKFAECKNVNGKRECREGTHFTVPLPAP